MSRSFITVKKTSTKIIEEDLYFDLYLGHDIRNFIKEEEYMSFDDIFEKVFDGVFFNKSLKIRLLICILISE